MCLRASIKCFVCAISLIGLSNKQDLVRYSDRVFRASASCGSPVVCFCVPVKCRCSSSSGFFDCVAFVCVLFC